MELRVTGGKIWQLAIDAVAVVLVEGSCLEVESIETRETATDGPRVYLSEMEQLAAKAASAE